MRGAERPSARDDRDLVYAVAAFEAPCGQGMARFVVGRLFLFSLTEYLFAFSAHEDFVSGVIEVLHVDRLFVIAGGPQRGFVDEVADIRSGQTDGRVGQSLQVDIVRQWNFTHVNFEDLYAAFAGGTSDRHMAVKTSGAQ